jgi:hypothetical protein
MQFNALKSTRSMRRRLNVTCSLKSDQKCHKVGLNLIKVLFNHDVDGWEKDVLLFDTIVKWINLDSNIYCCSVQVNANDKEIEECLLDCILYQRRSFSSLSQDSVSMYTLLMSLLYAVSNDDTLAKKSPRSIKTITTVIDLIRQRVSDKDMNSRIDSNTSDTMCFMCDNGVATQFDPVFIVLCCSEVCQSKLWVEHGRFSSCKSMEI